MSYLPRPISSPIRLLGLGVAVFVAGIVPAGQYEPHPSGMTNAGPGSYEAWLDAVRAQRQARKEAIDAQRRRHDPWGAALREAREQEHQRRREALRARIEQDRAEFRNQPPWDEAYRAMDEQQGLGYASPRDEAQSQAGGEASFSPLQGWDNHWYYRSY